MTKPDENDNSEGRSIISGESPENRTENEFRVMIVDGEGQISVDYSKDGCHKIEQLESLEQAITLLSESRTTEMRGQVHLLLSKMSSPDRREMELKFLSIVSSMQNRPYVVVQGDGLKVTELRGIADEIIPACMTNEQIFTAVTPATREHHKILEDLMMGHSLEKKPFLTSKCSPLPALQLDKFDPSRDSHNLLETKLKGVNWLAMLDFDGTLYRPNSEHTIILHDFALFMKSQHAADFEEGMGNLEALNELIDYCSKWETQRKRISQSRVVTDRIKYEKGIKNSGNLSAAAFENMEIGTLRKYGHEFVSEYLNGEFYDYVPDVLQKIKDHGILPVLVTGAPDFLLPAILKKIGMTHGNGMTYRMDRKGWLIGEVETNMGLAEEKARHGEELTKRSYAIVLAIGDSVGDMGPFRCAVGRSLAKWDVNGGAVLVYNSDNAVSNEAAEEVKRNYSNEMRGGDEINEKKKDARVQIVDRKFAAASNVTAAVGCALRAIFAPAHEYDKNRRSENPFMLAKQLADLEKSREVSKTFDNIENIKRIRDALELEGLPKQEILAILEQFYPPIIAKEVVKKYVINTEIPSDIRTWLETIGASREVIDQILRDNFEYYRKDRSLAPIIRRSPSSIPPPLKPASED